MDKLKQLLSKCKCEVALTVNQHRSYYKSAAEYLEDMDHLPDQTDDLDPVVRAKMIELDTVINIRFYPETPIGNYSIYYYDLDVVLDEALARLEREKS